MDTGAPPAGLTTLRLQHGILQDRLKGLRHLTGPADREALARLLRDLSDYLRRHFAFEEELMEASAYPRLAEHARAHRAFEGRIAELEASLREHSTQVGPALVGLLERWLELHEKREDQPFLVHLGQR